MERNMAVLLIFILYVIGIVYSGSAIFQHPYIGAYTEATANGVLVTDLDAGGWGEVFLQERDAIVETELETELPLGTVEGITHITVERAGKIVSYDIKYQDVPGQILYQIAIPFALVVACSIYIIQALRERSIEQSNVYMMLFSMSLSISYFSAGASARGDELAGIIMTLCFVLTPYLFVHYLFYRFSSFLYKRYIYRALQLGYCLIGIAEIYSIKAEQALSSLLSLFLFSLGLLLLFGTLLLQYMYSKNAEEKRILQALSSGLALAFCPFFLLYCIPQLFFQRSILPAYMTVAALVILPAILFYIPNHTGSSTAELLFRRLRLYSFILLLSIGVVVCWRMNTEINLSSLFFFILFLLFCFRAIVTTQSHLQQSFNRKEMYEEGVLLFPHFIIRYRQV